MRKITITIKI